MEDFVMTKKITRVIALALVMAMLALHSHPALRHSPVHILPKVTSSALQALKHPTHSAEAK